MGGRKTAKEGRERTPNGKDTKGATKEPITKGRRDRRLEQRKDRKEEPEEGRKLHERGGTRNAQENQHRTGQSTKEKCNPPGEQDTKTNPDVNKAEELSGDKQKKDTNRGRQRETKKKRLKPT